MTSARATIAAVVVVVVRPCAPTRAPARAWAEIFRRFVAIPTSLSAVAAPAGVVAIPPRPAAAADEASVRARGRTWASRRGPARTTHASGRVRADRVSEASPSAGPCVRTEPCSCAVTATARRVVSHLPRCAARVARPHSLALQRGVDARRRLLRCRGDSAAHTPNISDLAAV